MNGKDSVHFSSASNEWATPQHVFNWVDARFHFTLDPCCRHETAKCKKHFTIKEDGLKQDWRHDVVFMNPPYGRAIGIWVKKAYEEAMAGAVVVCLIPARTDTKWWYKYCTQAAEIMFVVGRLKFVSDCKASSAPFPSCFVVFDFKNATGQPKCSWVKLPKN